MSHSTQVFTPSRARSRAGAWPSLAQLWGIATIALLMLRVNLTPIAQNDFWWHIATGRLIAETGSIPTADQFSYTQAGQPYYNQPWLAQLLMYTGLRIGGPALLEIVQMLLIGVTFGLLYRLCRRIGAGPRVATLTTLIGALISMDNWQIRPQTYALPLFVATLSIVWTWRQTGRARLWLLPALMLVWVNTHGTFTLLIVLCGATWLGAAIERMWRTRGRTWPELRNLALWSAAAVLATIANPQGVGVWRYVAGLLGNRAVSSLVTEWGSPWRLIDEPMAMIFFGVLAAFAGVCVWRRRNLHAIDLLIALPFALLALQSVRNILWFGVIAAPIAANLLRVDRTTSGRRIEVPLMNRTIAALLLFLLVATLPWWKETIGLPPKLGSLLSEDTPIAAVAQLRALPQYPQRLFHDMSFGSYLIWEAPDQRVFVDPRIELFPYEQWRDYIDLGQGKRIDELTRRYGFDGWLVSPRHQQGLFEALSADPRWQPIITTDAAVYFAPRR